MQSSDYLKLSGKTPVLKLLVSCNAHNEKIIFSDVVKKINRKGSTQKRILMITTRAIYNLENNKCKRRIEVQDIGKIIVSRVSDQFILHIPKEYDYHYSSSRSKEITSILEKVHHVYVGESLTVETLDDKDLTKYVLTKKDLEKRNKSAHMARRSSAGDLMKSMQKLGLAEEKPQMPKVEGETHAVFGEKVTIDDFELLKVLGKGSFGKVMQVKKKGTGEILAMKILQKDKVLEKHQLEHTKAERHILQAVQHPFMVHLRFAFQSESKLYMILDYVNGGELFFHLQNSVRFSEVRARLYGAEILLALGHLHKLGIIYRDLKPENILLDKEGHVRLTDFGLAKQNIDTDNKTYTFCGTPEYLAPEVVTSEGHGRGVDWWSLGTLIYEMMNGLPPFYDPNMTEMYKKIIHQPLNFPSFFSASAKDLLSKLLERNPEKRLGSGEGDVEEIKAHPFFESIDWDKLYKREVETPFKPQVGSDTDVQNFDSCFTNEIARDSVVAPAKGNAGGGTANFDGFTFMPQGPLKR
ncbi:protein kinase [Chloropicon primus]|uniref:non-specific serine/threonine protein kinase n=1 Tax=Chloropicon primus TaxID=1764295 RepID=A0A5B8MCM0_9CHLO|nr:protein kinase [Chloropicon primus]|eukprot:QDZ17804.1 protein kinase [Chloropicon primus]